MPVVAPGSFVLVTGASGFLAVHVVQQLLQRGFKGQYLDSLFKSQKLDAKWEWIVVEDLEKDGAFNEAVKGVDGVAHTASPFHYRVEDPYLDLINPAVRGTLSLLNAALTEPKINRVAITSSNAAFFHPHPPPYTITEKDWNTSSVAEVEAKGKDAAPQQSYRASKTLAERAAWKFVEEHTKDGQAPFAISTINPPLIFGPVLHDVPSASSLNTSVNAFYAFLTGAKKDEQVPGPGGNFVDVRDVAKLHIEALLTEGAANERFAASNNVLDWQAFIDFLHEPEQKELIEAFPKIVRGIPGKEPGVQNWIDASKARKTFGWEPIPWQKTVIDMTASLAEKQKSW
ncbi:D-lactaldehyde dehydrogenase [Pseudohyphozyma bogoriensis]|nr:D-lactaldehyde dehydrogenase [Pseudohyphozyma bogoriensis]